MKISFVAGFGPIVSTMTDSLTFYRDALGIQFEGDESYAHTDELGGVRAFALWRLTDAAQSCFETEAWPASLPVPQAWIEFDVASHELVSEAAKELEGRGYRLVRQAKKEEWGQTVARLLSPEGLLVGNAHTPWMHKTSHPA